MIYRILILILISSTCFGQNSLLWQITKENVKDTSYLYGTIHLANKKYFYVNSKVHDIKKKVDAGVFELILNTDSLAYISKILMAGEGERITDVYSTDEQRLIFEYFQSKLGFQEVILNQFKPIALSNYMIQILMPPDTIGAVDQLLQNDFTRGGKSIFALESVKMQSDIFFQIPMSVQKEELLESIQKEDSLNNAMKELDSVYCNQDLKGISLLLDDLKNHKYLSKELMNDSRNIKMIPKIEDLLSKQSNLICVGAAHLSGDKGLIKLLRKKGYTLVPIN
ncbi:MAG: hypothetical protein CMP67_01180 [Flavobacteriales bacterium]|nr:hypothetical protein [Flavobacteriales bacterium]MBO73500.1 hypothetical protein [Flavobacteriales bacterium]|tara:strand:- start:1263 stop:2105 length:843 start_codon:yes stop_codon:yes gene_type:complete